MDEEDPPGATAEAQLATRIDRSTLPHIEIARSIQDRIWRATTRDEKTTMLLEAIPNPSYLITSSETVLAANALAAAKHGRTPATLAECIPDIDLRAQILDFVSRDNSGKLLALAGHASSTETQSSVMVKRIDASLRIGDADDVFLLSIIDFGFDSEAIELFRHTYALTDAESQVAVLLASGLQHC